MKYTSSLQCKLIYVLAIDYDTHKGCLKIGEATSDNPNIWELEPNSQLLNESAKKRIRGYTQTAGIRFTLLHTELAVYNKNGKLESFKDTEVHDVLVRSGIKKKVFEPNNNEWFITDLETAKNAIKAVKEGRDSLNQNQITKGKTPVIFRQEQEEAINKTIKHFRKGSKMLWNAKMRFGKTLSALQLIKNMGFSRTLIMTHRPVVDNQWFEDFSKIFYEDKSNYKYGSRKNGDLIQTLLKNQSDSGLSFIYFASMQDLRGSARVGGGFDKNDEIFNVNWDLVVIDEAHEGTQTELGKNVMHELVGKSTKVLHLSGTPFNLLEDFQESEIYTWDYVMEQRAKKEWDENHFGDHNPYASLPKMNIFTFDLGRLLNSYVDEDVAFNFREFFRVGVNGKFIHENDVNSFLNLICQENSENNYPYSTSLNRDNFRHSLWMVPGVKEAQALSTLLQSHTVFGHFDIVNVAGEGDEDETLAKDALRAVKQKIGDNPEETYTITISCGRLTTGVSIEAWTAVFMLSGSYSTSASTYMQTIFRVQTPAIINGKVKTDCYVFDFAPDRTLKVIAETAKISSKAGKSTIRDEEIMREFLNFCPIIGVQGSRMIPYDVNGMLEQLKRYYVERVVKNGFEDSYLYNTDQLMKLTEVEVNEFMGLKSIIGSTKAIGKSGEIDINKQGFTDEEYSQLEKVEKKKRTKNELTEQEKQLLKERDEKRKQRDDAISILRGISIRMPLLIYGADIEDEDSEITIENFSELIDSQSWEEFMPKGVTKEVFSSFIKYYDPIVFRASGKKIRALARQADYLSIEDRVARITGIFNNFRNPDKETILTPWRVVNMHLGDCIGGYVFFDEEMEKTINTPRFLNQGDVTSMVFSKDSKILEINSKTGLYPLYLAYSLYRFFISSKYTNDEANIGADERLKIWDKVVSENLFVICKTPMAKSITKRTLVGFRKTKVNTRYFEDLVNQITNNQEGFLKKIRKGSTYWKSNNSDDMKFNAIVGNPPYQVNDGSGASDDASNPIYQNFVRISKRLNPDYISFIMPSKWMIGGKAILKPFRKEMMEDYHLSKLFDYEDSGEIFSGQHIDGGICYFLWEQGHQKDHLKYVYKTENGVLVVTERSLKDGGSDIIIRDYRRQSIIEKVANKKSFSLIVSARKPFGINTDLFNNTDAYPEFKFSTERFPDSVLVWGVYGIKGGAKRISGFIILDSIPKKRDWVGKWKLLISKAFSANAINPPEIIEAGPGVICTETFLVVGTFDNEADMKRCHKFMKSNFFKILLFFGRGTMQVSQDVFRFIPLQDFSNKSDINWNNSIEKLDEHLYAKYGFTKDEIDFIESLINPM
jgi:hypothetical protein